MGYIEELEGVNWKDVAESHIETHREIMRKAGGNLVDTDAPTPYQIIEVYNRAITLGYIGSSIEELFSTGSLDNLLNPSDKGLSCTSLAACIGWGISAEKTIGWKNPAYVVTTGTSPRRTIPHASLMIEKAEGADFYWNPNVSMALFHFAQSSTGDRRKAYIDEVADYKRAPSLTSKPTLINIIKFGRMGRFISRYTRATKALITITALSLEDNWLKEP